MLRRLRILLLVLSVVLPATAAHAQGTTGSADIRVIDADGNAVRDATITIYHPATGLARQKHTDSNGKI